MAVNLASKYSSKIDERFARESLTDIGTNKDYEFAGVKTVSVYQLTAQDLGDYTRTGTARYGTPNELQNTKQDLTLSQDKSFAMTIDAGNAGETAGAETVGKAISIQTNEKIVPLLDTYRLAAMATAAVAASGVATAASTAANAYTQFLAGCSYMSNASVPLDGRVAWVSPAFYNFLKLDTNFIKASEMGQKMLAKGVIGEVDGVKIVLTPTNRLPANTSFIMAHPSAVVAPVKLKELTSHDNPPGINGTLIEGRVIHDCFVLNGKAAGVYTHKTA